MRKRQTRHPGWARVLLLAAILAGVFAMHTSGHAEDGSSAAAHAVPAAVGHGMTMAHGASLHASLPDSTDVSAGHASPARVAHPGAPGLADPTAADPHRHLGCDLASMCVALLAGAAVLLALARARGAVPRGPTSPVRALITRCTVAPAHPPSLAVLSVLRT